MTYTHISAPTQFVQAGAIRFAYRRFGQDTGVPLLFMPHFRAGMDHWDPAVTDGFAASRPVILFDNAGVAGSSGKTPETIEAMADYAADFVGALGVSTVGAAITAWREVRGERYSELANIPQPTLVVNGNHDIMVPTINSFILSQKIPQAQLIIYPDSGHGALFQFSELFVAHGTLFLNGST